MPPPGVDAVTIAIVFPIIITEVVALPLATCTAIVRMPERIDGLFAFGAGRCKSRKLLLQRTFLMKGLIIQD